MKYRAYLWDFDGTLFDTYDRVTRAYVKALADFGIYEPFARVRAAVKLSLRTARDLLAPAIDFSRLMDCYHLHAEEEGYESMRPYPGAKEFCRKVSEKGGVNVLYTHRGLSGVEALKHYDMARDFVDFVTSEDGYPSKPAPDAILAIVERNHLNKAECIMLGDRDIDMGAAQNAGIACALFDPENRYPGAASDFRADTFDGLTRLLLD